MSIYSPATYMANGLAVSDPVLLTDKENNFSLLYGITFTKNLYSVVGGNAKAILIGKGGFFNAYAIRVTSIRIFYDGWVNIEKNGIYTQQPINLQSQFLITFFLLRMGFSKTKASLNTTTTTSTLATLYSTNKNECLSYFQPVFFYYPDVDLIGNSRIPLRIRKPELFEMNYYYEQYSQGFYLNLLHGVGEPNYDVNLDFSGNGLLDYEFNIIGAAGSPTNVYYNYNQGNYGSRFYYATTPAVSCKIESIYIQGSILIQGQILELKKIDIE